LQTDPDQPVPIKRWILALGLAGFLSGYVGPILLNPDANQGPLLGLLITGPGGALAGLLLGFVARQLPISNSLRRQTLWTACAVISVGTLYACLPDPALLGYVIDGDVAECAPANSATADAIAEWEQSIARVTWAAPVAEWKERATHAIDSDHAVVLTLHIERRSPVYQLRKPWDFHRQIAGPWSTVDSPKRYYARDEGGSCATYLSRDRRLYWPFSDSSGTPTQPSKEWPPVEEPATFLSLQILGPVPAQIQRLLP
jgi:hypothetical protein